jgi:predicted nucleic-acid-binding protein
MTKKKPKKPTLNEVKQVVENLLHDLQIVNNKVDSLALVVNTYIEYKKDEDDFMKYMKEQWEKNSDKQRTANKDSK